MLAFSDSFRALRGRCLLGGRICQFGSTRGDDARARASKALATACTPERVLLLSHFKLQFTRLLGASALTDCPAMTLESRVYAHDALNVIPFRVRE